MRFLNSRLALLLTLAVAFLCVPALQSRAARSGWGFDTEGMDRTCEPCRDFFQFANGGWIDKNPIPAAFPSWTRFGALAEQNNDRLHEILEAAAKNTKAPRGSLDQKIGDYYASFMDEAKIEAEGTRPLAAEMALVAGIKDLADLQEVVAHQHGIGVPALFGFGAGPDFKDAARMVAGIGQAGMALPDREYYFKDSEQMKQVRDAYVKHIARMFELLGETSAQAAADARTVMSVETKMAENAMNITESRDPKLLNNPVSISELKAMAGAIAWEKYFKARGTPAFTTLNVGQPKYFKALNRLLAEVTIADWKTYLRWQLLNYAASDLPAKFVEEDFNFNSRLLTGAKEMLPRWKRAANQIQGVMGEAIGRVYVERLFPPEAKQKALELIKNMRAVLRDNLSQMDWMSEATRRQAVAKLDTLIEKIGYPDKWIDYTPLVIERGSLFDNDLRAARFAIDRNIRQIGKPTDRGLWLLTTPQVNAYYSAPTNEITFPAGILQSPFFDPKADAAVNYGGIGAVIGHELFHGFDDRGSQFDGRGNLSNWWTAEDRKSFDARAACVERQFSGYKVGDDLYTNGKLVLGESISDLGGVALAYQAYQKSLEGKPRPAVIDGFTPEQRFFLGFAQVWGGSVRPEFVRLLTETDPHPLPRLRVNGPLANLEIFARAFGCKAGDPMVRAAGDRCRVW